MRTSAPDVYAVGDVAAFPLKRYGNTTRQVNPPSEAQRLQGAQPGLVQLI